MGNHGKVAICTGFLTPLQQLCHSNTTTQMTRVVRLDIRFEMIDYISTYSQQMYTLMSLTSIQGLTSWIEQKKNKLEKHHYQHHMAW